MHNVLIICQYFRLIFCKSDSEASMIHQPHNPAAHFIQASCLSKTKSTPEEKLKSFHAKRIWQINTQHDTYHLTHVTSSVSGYFPNVSKRHLKEILLQFKACLTALGVIPAARYSAMLCTFTAKNQTINKQLIQRIKTVADFPKHSTQCHQGSEATTKTQLA